MEFLKAFCFLGCIATVDSTVGLEVLKVRSDNARYALEDITEYFEDQPEEVRVKYAKRILNVAHELQRLEEMEKR